MRSPTSVSYSYVSLLPTHHETPPIGDPGYVFTIISLIVSGVTSDVMLLMIHPSSLLIIMRFLRAIRFSLLPVDFCASYYTLLPPHAATPAYHHLSPVRRARDTERGSSRRSPQRNLP